MSHTCNGLDRLAAAFEAEDWERVMGIALRARLSDDRCQCERPIVEGLDLMCRCCLLENDGQREKRTAWIQEPHAFEEGRHSDIGMCARCTGWRDDARHEAVR